MLQDFLHHEDGLEPLSSGPNPNPNLNPYPNPNRTLIPNPIPNSNPWDLTMEIATQSEKSLSTLFQTIWKENFKQVAGTFLADEGYLNNTNKS